MSSHSFAPARGRGARISAAAASEQAVLAAAAHLTSRDRSLVRAVGEHRLLTTAQLAALGFGSVITARHRLTVLVQIGALRRFRPHREIGSAPWHYLLGPVGAALLGAEDRDDKKRLTAVRADRQLALAHSQRLAHITGVNWFFPALAAHARQSGDGTELQGS
jgi:Replication-relaxation